MEESQAGDQDKEEYFCPIPATHDKFDGAYYFFHRMLEEYHEPLPFRWNLNAFLQALRTVTFMLQAELSDRAGYKDWYAQQQVAMKSDELLKAFAEGRTTIVHKGMLRRKSKVEAGVFRFRTLKLGLGHDLDPDVSSKAMLSWVVENEQTGPKHPFGRVESVPNIGQAESSDCTTKSAPGDVGM